jgi:hypothetical protein
MSDICAALRQDWIYLAVYYIVAVPITLLVWRQFRLSRFLHSRRPRLILAAALAVVFTPSVISDFFLVMIPGPAVLGFLLLLPTMVMKLFSDPGLVFAVFGTTCVYHLLPMSVCFAVGYAILRCLERHYCLDAAPTV